jgi:hypothetical protein
MGEESPDDIEMEEDEYNRIQTRAMTALHNLNSNNRFYTLSGGDESDWEDVPNNAKRRKTKTKNGNQVQPQKSTKPPPLVVLHTNTKELQAELAALGIKDFEMRMAGDSTRIFCKNNEDYEKVKKNFIDNTRAFFTHSLKEDQLSKFVLSGLPKMTDDEVKDALTMAGKTPKMVKTMQTRSARSEHHALYLVFFMKKDRTRLRDLHEISVVSHMRVRWANYENKRAGPSQCSNCQRFGHGALHCHAIPRCVRCAEEHLSKECPLIKTSTGETLKRIQTDLLVCVHCRLQHSANFSGCQKRIQFIKSRQTATRNTKQPSSTREAKFAFGRAPELNEANFPSIPNQNGSHPAWFQATGQPGQQHQEPSQQGAPKDQQPKSTGERSIPLNIEEMFAIYSEMVEVLKVARTQQEQINALMKLALKFVAPLYV